MTFCDFQLCDDLSCNSYCATGVFYVSLNTFRNIFTFQTNEISNNNLSQNTISDICANITYYVDSSLLPTINPSHAMLDSIHSKGIIFNSISNENNLLKHDYIYYLGKQIFGHPSAGAAIISNRKLLLDQIEITGWSYKNTIETFYSISDNSGNGMTNNDINQEFNITRSILNQIFHFDPSRCIVSETPQNNRIQNTTDIQSVPLDEGDSVNYIYTLKNNDAPERSYRIKLYLTNDTSNVNTIPSYTFLEYDGVPQVQ